MCVPSARIAGSLEFYLIYYYHLKCKVKFVNFIVFFFRYHREHNGIEDVGSENLFGNSKERGEVVAGWGA